MTLPQDPRQFARQRKSFEAWLVANGSAILSPTNSYELMRFTGTDAVAIVYRNECGRLKWINGADVAFESFKGSKPWRACEKGKRESSHARKRRLLYVDLQARDGDTCMYCGVAVTLDEFSPEHVLSITHGGSSHLANMAITHGLCNAKASHLSVREKFALAMRMRCEGVTNV